jgi:hypothetical protein
MNVGLIDIWQAVTSAKVNIYRTFVDLKAMNKKFVFTVGLKEPRKMVIKTEFRSLNAMIASVSF